jgi:hypothetical protein
MEVKCDATHASITDNVLTLFNLFGAVISAHHAQFPAISARR